MISVPLITFEVDRLPFVYKLLVQRKTSLKMLIEMLLSQKAAQTTSLVR